MSSFEKFQIVGTLSAAVLETIFSYLSLKDLSNCALVCKRWHKVLSDENSDMWRHNCMKEVSEEIMTSDLLSSITTYKSKLRAFHHAWNPNDRSRNVFIKPNGFTIHR